MQLKANKFINNTRYKYILNIVHKKAKVLGIEQVIFWA